MRFKTSKLIINEAIEVHEILNPKLFDQEGFLKKDVSQALIRIVNSFIEEVKEQNIPLNVIDVWLVGSNASFNYSTNSDIDIHLIVNIEENKSLLELLYNYIKGDFNKSYNIQVKGSQVEIYIEGTNTTSISNGIYSILYNEWIKSPKPIQALNIDVENSELFKLIYSQYINLIQSYDFKSIQDFINRLYILRKASLVNEGEFGIGNLVFKEIRNRGYLEQLKTKLKEIKSKELTLEHFK